MDLIDQSGLDIAGAMFALIVAGVVHVIIVRRLTTTLFDPVCYVALAGVFSIATTHTLASLGVEIYVWLAFAAFWFGVLMVSPKLGVPCAAISVSPTSADQDLALKIVVGLLSILLIGVNVFLWLRVGVPAFSDDPSLAKGEFFEGGFGFVRRLNWGVGVFSLFGASVMFIRHPSSIWVVFLLGLIGIAVLGGSKGSLLSAVFVVGLLTEHPQSMISESRKRLSRNLLLVLVPLALAAGMAILLVESDDIASAAQRLVIRLFYFGDIMFYWSQDDLRREIISRYSAFQYLDHILNPLLGMLRISEYKLPIGNEIVSYSLGPGEEISAALGPNTPFYVMGPIFFGTFGGLIYGFIVGMAFGAIRRVFIHSSGRRPFQFCIWGTIVILSIALPTEDDLFVGMVTDFLLPLGIFYILSEGLIRASRRSNPSLVHGRRPVGRSGIAEPAGRS